MKQGPYLFENWKSRLADLRTCISDLLLGVGVVSGAVAKLSSQRCRLSIHCPGGAQGHDCAKIRVSCSRVLELKRDTAPSYEGISPAGLDAKILSFAAMVFSRHALNKLECLIMLKSTPCKAAKLIIDACEWCHTRSCRGIPRAGACDSFMPELTQDKGNILTVRNVLFRCA